MCDLWRYTVAWVTFHGSEAAIVESLTLHVALCSCPVGDFFEVRGLKTKPSDHASATFSEYASCERAIKNDDTCYTTACFNSNHLFSFLQ
jgi:hypothetical protein